MLKKASLILVCMLLAVFCFGLCCFLTIEYSTRDALFDSPDELPVCKTALVLGTAKHLQSGPENPFFTHRMDAAEKLFKAKKARYFILSGDNHVGWYNEPLDMKKELIKRGIPDSCLVLDYAGLRTFDSMVRCKDIFGQDSVIVVSQQFHNARAVFIGRKTGITAFALNAREVTTYKALSVKIREFFSRIKCILDLYILDTEPRHLGEKIRVG